MTPKWKRKVLAKLDELGKSIPWLATKVGLSRSAGYKLFAEKENGEMVQEGCAEVPQICELLGIDPPLVEPADPPSERDARIAELLNVAPDSLKDAVIEILSNRLKSDDRP
jgi:hypothetical protein